MTPKNPKLPWMSESGGRSVYNADGNIVCGSHLIPQTNFDRDNHRLIVRRVNQGPAFDAMKAALISLDEECDEGTHGGEYRVDATTVRELRAALALAEKAAA